ncbi:hypothetical protein EJ06DRAFT_328104 [Trichodelitschia bisporula]|uniref:Acyltransferase 3 domain-containing protein n=1 Tax=Trichodelitschia bisporula TaxID=703511 RepID=A0A6G1I1L6_9PEZI|nr:hypothetical protein EJ06DRAFT_328104 [Trichodelitschia bisporula]
MSVSETRAPVVRGANWIDGLRGIASFIVVTGHLCTSFVPHLHAPAASPTDAPLLFQLPFLRLCVGGRMAVAFFFLITGYVNALGPLSKSYAGDIDSAFHSVAQSALARSGRLLLPSACALLLSWLLANVGAYQMTQHVDSTWIRQGYRGPSGSVVEAVVSLVKAQVGLWTGAWEENYDGTQWTLSLFLKGSMVVYIVLFATVLVAPRARRMVLVVMWVYGWLSHNALMMMNITAGMFLADIAASSGKIPPRVHGFMAVLPPILMAVGMFICGYPQDAPGNAPWSAVMERIMTAITPEGTDLRRHWDSLGATMILVGIFTCEPARRVLTSSVCNYMGRVSFAVYLLHNQLIKTLLTWMVYLPSAMKPQVDEMGNPKDLARGPPLQMGCAIATFFYMLYRLAGLWNRWVDPMCVRVVGAVIRRMKGEGEKSLLG